MKKLSYSIKNRHKIQIDFDAEEYCIYVAGIHSGKSLICTGLACNHVYDTASLKKNFVNIFFYSAIYQYHSFLVLDHYLNLLKDKLINCCVLELDFGTMILKYINDSMMKRQTLNTMNRKSFVKDMCIRHIYSYYQTINFLQQNDIQYRTLKISDLTCKNVDIRSQFRSDVERYDLFVMKESVPKLDYEWTTTRLMDEIRETTLDFKKVPIFYTLEDIESTVQEVQRKAQELWPIYM